MIQFLSTSVLISRVQYADVDTQPLRRPVSWISPADTAPWTDPETDVTFSSHNDVGIILGIEADCSPEKNDYWRMGYLYPVQLTQWALAATVGHPVLLRFMDTLQYKLNDVARQHHGNITAVQATEELRRIGPVSLTGPGAVTLAAMNWLDEQFSVRWNSLSGLLDGGQSKLVEDVLVLPITGFRCVPSPA